MLTLPQQPITAQPPVLTRCQKLLREEVRACDDPICSCEAEPRWLAMQQASEQPLTPSEWEVLERSPADEL